MTTKEILFHLVYTFLWGSLLYWLCDRSFTPLTIFTCLLALGAAGVQLNYLVTAAAERY